jgi:hypothetical protein
MMRILIAVALIGIVSVSCSMEKLYSMKQRNKVHSYEQIDFHDLMKRYVNKEQSSVSEIEGIYSVSMIVYKKGKGVLSSTEKEKVAERKENYTQVAIIKDTDGANREYVEVPLDKKFMPSYSIRGEFSRMADANILIYKHFESRGRESSYTFTFDRAKDILEGVRKENNGQFEYTYQLTYMKLQTKQAESSRK